MRSKTNFWQIIALIAVIGLLFAACGDSGSGSTTDPGTDDPSGGSSGGSGFYPGSKNPGTGTSEPVVTIKPSTAVGEVPAGLTITATDSGATITGTTVSGMGAAKPMADFDPPTKFKTGGNFDTYTYAYLNGIINKGESVYSIKEENESLFLYQTTEANFYNQENQGTVYKKSFHSPRGGAYAEDDTFGFLMWNGAVNKRTIFTITYWDPEGTPDPQDPAPPATGGAGTVKIVTINWPISFAGTDTTEAVQPSTGAQDLMPDANFVYAAETGTATDKTQTMTVTGNVTEPYPASAAPLFEGGAMNMVGTGKAALDPDNAALGYSIILVKGVSPTVGEFGYNFGYYRVKEINDSLGIYKDAGNRVDVQEENGHWVKPNLPIPGSDPETTWAPVKDAGTGKAWYTYSFVWEGVPKANRTITYIVEFSDSNAPTATPDLTRTITVDWSGMDLSATAVVTP